MKYLSHYFKDKGKASTTPYRLVPFAGPIIEANGLRDAQAKAAEKGFFVNGEDEQGFVFSGLLPA